MNSNATRSTARVVRLADLDDLYRPPPAAAPQSMNEFREDDGSVDGARASSNDSVSPGTTGWSSSSEAGVSRAMHPIGSTLPGALPDGAGGAGRAPWTEDVTTGHDSLAQEPDAYFPPRDVPRLPRGRVLKVSVHVDARAQDYARLWWGNVAMLLVSLGLAWPWAYRRRERYFLRHTKVASHRLDFRLSAGMLWPRYATMLALWVGVAGAWSGSLWAGLIGLTLGCAVWPTMAYLKINQRVASITWAGRRLWFDGTWHGMSRAMLVPTVLAIALVWSAGLAWHRQSTALAWLSGALVLVGLLITPMAVWRYVHYRQHHLRLGPLRLQWKASLAEVAGVFARAAALAALVGVLTAGVACLPVAAWLAWRHGSGGVPRVAVLAVAVLVLSITGVVVSAYLRARMGNLVWNHTGNRHLRFRSRVPVGRYVGLAVRHAMLTVLTLGIYRPWGEVALRALRLHSLKVASRVDPEVLLAYWSRRQGEAPPTLFPSVSVSRDDDELSRMPTQPAVAARHGPPA